MKEIDQRAQRHDPASKHTHDSNDRPDKDAPQPVRPAGPENQKDPPPDWSKTDEEGDESFPASDPPANY